MHGGGSVEACGAVVAEAASALAVDDVGGVLGVGGVDAGEVGAVGEPPAPLAVEVLDLAALPRRVRIAEPGVRCGSARRCGLYQALAATGDERPETALNVAVTVLVAFIVTTQLPVPVQAPDQPAKVLPERAAAVNLTTVPEA